MGALLGRMGSLGWGTPARYPWPHLLPSVRSPFPLTPAGLGVHPAVSGGFWLPCPLRCPLPSLVLGRQLRPLGSHQPPSPLPGGPASPEVTMPRRMNGIPAEGREACGGAGLATARGPSSLASGGTTDQTAPSALCPPGTHGAWPQPQPPGGATGGLPEGVGSSSARRGDRWERPHSALPDLWPPSPRRRAGGSRGIGGRRGPRAQPA